MAELDKEVKKTASPSFPDQLEKIEELLKEIEGRLDSNVVDTVVLL